MTAIQGREPGELPMPRCGCGQLKSVNHYCAFNIPHAEVLGPLSLLCLKRSPDGQRFCIRLEGHAEPCFSPVAPLTPAQQSALASIRETLSSHYYAKYEKIPIDRAVLEQLTGDTK